VSYKKEVGFISVYCGSCASIDERKKKCDKYDRKLAYVRYSGAVKYTVYEKCRECRERQDEEDEN
jgi:hypothetical protein